MADNLPNIPLPANQWVDLYAAAGVPVGTSIGVENVGGGDDVFLIVSATEPTDDSAYNILVRDGEVLQNQQGALGAWAKSKFIDGLISVFPIVEAPGFTPLDATSKPLGSGINTDAWGVQKVSFPYSLFHGMWTFDIPSSMWLRYENQTEVATSTNVISQNGVAHLVTDATNTDVKLESREAPRYQPNRGHLFSMAGWFPNKTADGVREFGLSTNENGVFFRLKSDGLLYAVLRSGGVQIREELIDLSGLPTFDVEKNNTYDIQMQWRSAGNQTFWIGNPASGFSKLVHTFNNLGTLTGPSLENPALPVCFRAIRTTANVEMNIGCADITSENGRTDTERFGSAYAEDVAVNGTNVPVLTIRQPLLIGSVTNTRGVTLARISVKCDKKAVFKVWITRDLTALTGGTFQPVNSGSFVESDSIDMDPTSVKVTSIDTTKLHFVDAIPVEANNRVPVDNPYRGRIEFPVVRGDYIIISVTSTNSLATATIEWGEQI